MPESFPPCWPNRISSEDSLVTSACPRLAASLSLFPLPCGGNRPRTPGPRAPPACFSRSLGPAPTAAGFLILLACVALHAELGLGCAGPSLRAPTELHAQCPPFRGQIRGLTAPMRSCLGTLAPSDRPLCLKLEPFLSVRTCPALFQGLTQRAQHTVLPGSARLENNSLSSKPPRSRAARGSYFTLTSVILLYGCVSRPVLKCQLLGAGPVSAPQLVPKEYTALCALQTPQRARSALL